MLTVHVFELTATLQIQQLMSEQAGNDQELGKASTAQISKRRRRIFAAVACCLGLLFALLAAELALRIYVASRGWTANCYVTGLAFFVPHPEAGYTLRPNLRLKSSTYDIRTNSLGLRGPEITLDKPAGMRRILVLGGSSVFGYSVPDGKESCRVLERLLQDQAVDVGNAAVTNKVQVLNGGVPGYTVSQCRQRYQASLTVLDSDVVLLYLGWNDLKHLTADTDDISKLTASAPPLMQRILAHSVVYGLVRYRLFPRETPRFAPPADVYDAISPEDENAFVAEVQELLHAIRESGAQAVLSTQLLAANGNDAQLDSFLGTSREQIENNRKLGQWLTRTIRDIGEQTQTPVIDVAAQLAAGPDLLSDAIHLTEAGHRAVAEVWANSPVLF